MVFGRVNKEMIGLNEETLWTKQNPDRRNPDSLAHLAEIRRLLLAGKPLEANFVAEYASFGRPHYQATYQTLATLKLLVLDHQIEWASDYRRVIDLDSGLVTIEYQIGDVRHRREVFASQPDDVVVVRLESSAAELRQVAMNLYRKQDAVGTCLDAADPVADRPVRQPRDPVRIVAPGRPRGRHRRGGRRPPRGARPGSDDDRHRRGERLPPRRLRGRGRGGPSTRRSTAASTRSGPITCTSTATRCAASASRSAMASPTRPPSSPRCRPEHGSTGSATEATIPGCSPSSSSSGATCSSGRAARGRCRRTSRGSGTRCTSRRGTASSRSTSTPR